MKLWVEEALGFRLNWWQRLWLLPTDRKWRRQYSTVLRIVEQVNQCGDESCVGREEDDDGDNEQEAESGMECLLP